MMDGSNDTIKIVGTIEGAIPEHMQKQESEDVRTALSPSAALFRPASVSAHPPVCAHPSCELTPDAGMLVCCVLRTLALLGRTRYGCPFPAAILACLPAHSHWPPACGHSRPVVMLCCTHLHCPGRTRRWLPVSSQPLPRSPWTAEPLPASVPCAAFSSFWPVLT